MLTWFFNFVETIRETAEAAVRQAFIDLQIAGEIITPFHPSGDLRSSRFAAGEELDGAEAFIELSDSEATRAIARELVDTVAHNVAIATNMAVGVWMRVGDTKVAAVAYPDGDIDSF